MTRKCLWQARMESGKFLNGAKKSGRGLPHSWTLRVHERRRTARSVLECAGPPALGHVPMKKAEPTF